MIELTKLNGTKIGVNPFQIIYCEETPDTIILFNTGQKIIVKEKVAVITEEFSDFLAGSINKGLRINKEIDKY